MSLSKFQKLKRSNLCKVHTFWDGKKEPPGNCLECWEVWRALENARKRKEDD